MADERAIKIVTFKIWRYDPDRDRKPDLKAYSVPVLKGMTVLDGLLYIKEELDSSLSWRASCRMGICGSCGMFINNLPRLACQTQVLELNSKIIIVKPLPNYPVIKDLVPDLGTMFAKHKESKPYIIRSDAAKSPEAELLQHPKELEEFFQFTYCIKCGLCLAACPTVATDRKFLGPQALASAYRYLVDSRDEGAPERIAAVGKSNGPWRCHLAGACSSVCPKGVDPALAIQMLKREMALRTLRLKRKKEAAKVALPPKEVTPKPGIPKAPEPTVKVKQR